MSNVQRQTAFLTVLILTVTSSLSPRGAIAQECDRYAPALYIHDTFRRLGTVNVKTGAVHEIGSMSETLTDIAFDADGNLYGINFINLYSINVQTAELTLIGPHGVAGANALVFSPDGTLYLASNRDTNLYIVDPNSGAASPVGDIGFESAGDLAFVGSTMYLSSDSAELIEIALSGPEPLGVSKGNIGYTNVFGLATTGDGLLFGTSGTRLLAIDTNTGQGTLVHDFGGQGLTGTNGSTFFEESGAIDSDGDGLKDDWEINGYTYEEDGVIKRIDFPAMGANPRRADIFVELDFLAYEDDPETSDDDLKAAASRHRITQTRRSLERVIEAFANSNYDCNPDGSTGIDLHVDAGPDSIMDAVDGTTWGLLSRSNIISFDGALGGNKDTRCVEKDCEYDWTQFDIFRDGREGEAAPNFDTARERTKFHYVLNAEKIGGTSRAVGKAKGGTTRSGFSSRSFIMGVENEGVAYYAAVFMHELGHNLGLGHGGTQSIDGRVEPLHTNAIPHYFSVMNYLYALGPYNNSPGQRIQLDYARYEVPILDERDLNEVLGLAEPDTGSVDPRIAGYTLAHFCNGGTLEAGSDRAIVENIAEGINWDCDDPNVLLTSVAVDINGGPEVDPRYLFYSQEEYVHRVQSDWNRIKFAGGEVSGLLTGIPSQEVVKEIPGGEPTREDMYASALYGSVDIEGPVYSVVEVGDRIEIQITNTGRTEETFRFTVTSPPNAAQLVPLTDERTLLPDETFLLEVDVTGNSPSQTTTSTYSIEVKVSSQPETINDRLLTLQIEPTSSVPPPAAPPASPPPESGSGGGSFGPTLFVLLLLASSLPASRICGRRNFGAEA